MALPGWPSVAALCQAEGVRPLLGSLAPLRPAMTGCQSLPADMLGMIKQASSTLAAALHSLWRTLALLMAAAARAGALQACEKAARVRWQASGHPIDASAASSNPLEAQQHGAQPLRGATEHAATSARRR